MWSANHFVGISALDECIVVRDGSRQHPLPHARHAPIRTVRAQFGIYFILGRSFCESWSCVCSLAQDAALPVLGRLRPAPAGPVHLLRGRPGDMR